MAKAKKIETAVAVLTKAVSGAVWEHPITGQDVEEGSLSKGTLVRGVLQTETLDGVLTRFQVYDGSGWQNYRTFGKLALEQYAPRGSKTVTRADRKTGEKHSVVVAR